MFFSKRKNDANILKEIYKKDRLVRYSSFLLGLFIIAFAFNVFILPNNIVYGVGGIAVILKNMYNFDPATVILISSLLLLVLSLIFMGVDKTSHTVIGSLLYPLFVKLSEWIIPLVDFENTETFIVIIYGAILTGFGLGLIFKAGFTTGGTDILNQIVAKYFKLSIGNSMFFTDGIIILCGFFVFGWQDFMYSVLAMYIISVMTDKVILGISQSKAFYIITDNETSVKKYVLDHLSHGVTVIEARGGFTGNFQKMILCIIPTREYFKAKEGIQALDPNAFFLVTDAYEVSEGMFYKKDKKR